MHVEGQGILSLPADLKNCSLHRLTSLGMPYCRLTENDMICLSELIPSMSCPKKFDISHNETDVQKDGLLQVLEGLSYSSVTALNIIGTGFSMIQTSDSFLAALKQLIDRSCGRLEKLLIGNHYKWAENCRAMEYTLH